MTIKFADLIRETTTTTGTGTYSLAGAMTGARSFSVLGNGAKTLYICTMGAAWEVGIGTVTTGSPNTLARTTVIASSNSDAAVNWGAGTKILSLTQSHLFHARFALSSAYSALTDSTVTGNNSIGIGGDNFVDQPGNIAIGPGVEALNFPDCFSIGGWNTGAALTLGYGTQGDAGMALGNGRSSSPACLACNKSYLDGSNSGTSGFGNAQGTAILPNVGAIALADGTTIIGGYNGANHGDLLPIRATTANAVATTIGPDGGSISYPGSVAIVGIITARQYSGSSGTAGDSKAWEVAYLAKNGTVVGSPTLTELYADAAASAWTVTFASGNLKATGEANKNISWSGLLMAAHCN